MNVLALLLLSLCSGFVEAVSAMSSASTTSLGNTSTSTIPSLNATSSTTWSLATTSRTSSDISATLSGSTTDSTSRSITRSTLESASRRSTTSISQYPSYGPTSSLALNSSSECLFPGGFDHCAVAAPAFIEFAWPKVDFVSVTVATVIYKVNTKENTTSTITEYHIQTEAIDGSGEALETVNNDLDFWNSRLHTTGVSMSGQTPVLTFTASIYSQPGAYFTLLTVLPSPSGYYNMNWLYEGVTAAWSSTDVSGSPASYCATDRPFRGDTYAITPTATPKGYDNPYYAPVRKGQWVSMVSAQYGCVVASVDPAGAQQYATALTETTTIYDDQVHSQTTKEAAASATSKATATAKSTASKVAATSQASKSSASAGASQPSPGPSQTAAASQASAPPSQTAVVIASNTIIPGASAVTISGTEYSLAASGNVLVVDGSSSLLPVSTETGTTSGLGGLIWSGLGGTVTASVVPATYTGVGAKTTGIPFRLISWLVGSVVVPLLFAS